MKKKIKDLTIGEILEACRQCGSYCPDCKLRNVQAIPCGMIYDETDNLADLDQEVEV